MTKQKQMLRRRKHLKLKLLSKSVNTITGVIVNINLSVDLNIQKKYVRTILGAKNAMKKHAKADIQKSVNGGKIKRDVKEITVITFM